MHSITISPSFENLNNTLNDNIIGSNDKHLDHWDISIVVIYFCIVLATGFFAMYRSNRGTVNGYFLAGRYMIWLPVGASVFASNIGSEHFIGLAGSGAASGYAVGAFELNALIILQIAGWVFLPVFIASRVCTLPEYMSKRFGGKRIRTYLAVLSMLLYIFTKISVNLYSGGIFIQQALGWNLYFSVILLLLVTSICTVTGGLTAVIYTDTFQCLIMILGAGTVAVKSLIEVGGLEGLEQKYMNTIPSYVPPNLTQCALPKEYSFQILRPANDRDMPWAGVIFGQTTASIWYWCADQMMVQRLLAAKSLSHAQGGTLFAGYLKILPLFLIVIPGMISRVLYTDEIACVDPQKCMEYCNNPVSCSNTAYPRLVLGIMPSPFKGLILAVMLAALMSDLSSIFNSSSTLFTCDIYQNIRKKAKISELMIVGRCFVIVMVLISILWIPIIQMMQNGQLYIYIQDIAANLSPPIAAVYLMAIIWKRINECGAFWSLMIGLLIGVLRMVLNIVYHEPSCGDLDLRPTILKLHYMYFSIILFWFTIICAVIISLLTKPVEEFRLIRTTYWTRFDDKEREDDKENLETKRSEQTKTKSIEIIKTIPNSDQMNGIEMLTKCDSNYEYMNESKNDSQFKNFLKWFCGVNYKTENEEKVNERLANIASIYQSTQEKRILRVFLIIIIIVAISLFTYFSLPLSSRKFY